MHFYLLDFTYTTYDHRGCFFFPPPLQTDFATCQRSVVPAVLNLALFMHKVAFSLGRES